MIALALREALETPQRTAALVTPDRDLARRVTAELRRWDIEIDDSAGQPLADTPPATLLRALLAAVDVGLRSGRSAGAAEASAVHARAGARRPARCGAPARPQVAARPEARSRHRGHRAHMNRPRTAIDRIGSDVVELVERLGAATAELAALMADGATSKPCSMPPSPLPNNARRPDTLWSGDAGEALADALARLRAAWSGRRPIAGGEWPALLATMLATETIRPSYGRHPRLAIWGPLEARLQRADLLVLGGLNEGSWPPAVETGPWINRPMRAALGLPQPERRIGLSAHDFARRSPPSACC